MAQEWVNMGFFTKKPVVDNETRPIKWVEVRPNVFRIVYADEKKG